MKDKVDKILSEIQGFVIETNEQLEKFRIEYVGRKGAVTALFGEMKHVAAEGRKAAGQLLNELKQAAQDKFDTASAQLKKITEQSADSGDTDLTLPPIPNTLGAVHPLSRIKTRIIEIFERIGFSTSEGPEIEDDWHNFSALNIPENHPAREMQDTFFIEKNPDMVLRTHTSSVQVRMMQNEPPPIRTLSIGRVYRNEAISARSNCFFHQAEGLYINENVSFVELKQALYHFVRELFSEDTELRFRASYFPFTEPSAEVDISCIICKGEGCNVCKYTGWLEIAGAGMVDPAVLTNCGIDPEKYTGYAFGMGLERMAMLKYGINDLRLFFDNDIRFLRQFVSL